jgi:DNA polymerase III delta subunit
MRELEILDKELNHKEEEIVMVMTLYKEVLALKQQVKSLKDRTSKENISVKSQPPKFNGYNNVTTAGLLNKLLQRVQHFQTHYKRH